MRARDLGIRIGRGRPGPYNAITDVAGVTVGHTTLIEGDGPLTVGRGPIRTGVTVVLPLPDDSWGEPVFAGCHRLNGNGELTGLEWIREAGRLQGPVAITNTHSVGVVRDALVAASVQRTVDPDGWWSLPVVGETYDGLLNDINGFHVRPEHVHAAIAAAAGGPVPEGNVGGGTGTICHEFKGGIGTASRVVADADGGFTVGVLVQANHGRRPWLRVDGVPVGELVDHSVVPSAYRAAGEDDDAGDRYGAGLPPPGSGSIIIVVATDAPLLPHQCDRLAQRAGLGIARAGATGGHTSGDLIVCFATGNRLGDTLASDTAEPTYQLRALHDRAIDPLFMATIEATEEAVINALVAAETMTGANGLTVHALPHDLLLDAMARHARGPQRRS
jgi:D-aminopeptidase